MKNTWFHFLRPINRSRSLNLDFISQKKNPYMSLIINVKRCLLFRVHQNHCSDCFFRLTCLAKLLLSLLAEQSIATADTNTHTHRFKAKTTTTTMKLANFRFLSERARCQTNTDLDSIEVCVRCVRPRLQAKKSTADAQKWLSRSTKKRKSTKTQSNWNERQFCNMLNRALAVWMFEWLNVIWLVLCCDFRRTGIGFCFSFARFVLE